uniref:Protein kinase domain-containing protein n=2 Tax=Parascaris univalens TaxID=6257 RepID=A0A915BJW7_PARUN
AWLSLDSPSTMAISSSCIVGGEEEDSNCALPQVGQTIEHRKHKFKILRKIWSGPFSSVFVVVDDVRNKKYAMKVERESDARRSVLKLDVFVLREFQNKKTPGFPRFITAGRTNHLKYVVLQLVGPDVNKLRRCLPGKKFCLSTALRLSQQTLKRIETLHDAGWISRDIKGSNFTVGLRQDSGTIYMLDFGFAKRFRDRTGCINAPRDSTALLGSIHYASMAAHAFRDQCRRDDVESWFYMCCEFIKGQLPWASLDPKNDHKLIGEWKRYARFGGREELLRDVPAEFDRILDAIDSIKFYDRPDYSSLSCLIEAIFYRLDLDRSSPFEWQSDPFLIEKATHIGDQGHSEEVGYRIAPDPTSVHVEVVRRC